MSMGPWIQQVRADWEPTLPWFATLASSMGLDILMGLSVAFAKKRLSSSISRLGMTRKLAMVSSVLMAGLFDGLFPSLHVLGTTVTLATLACWWWLVTEWLSIVEKWALLGLPLPPRAREALIKVSRQLDAAIPVPVTITEPVRLETVQDVNRSEERI